MRNINLTVIGGNWNFVTLSGICDANGCFKYGLNLELVSVNCVKNGVFCCKGNDCDANAFLRICELVLCNVGSCGANGRFNLCEGPFDFNRLIYIF